MTPDEPHASPRSEMDQAIADTVAQVTREEAEAKAAFKRRVRPRRTAGLLLVVLLAANIVGWVVFPPARLDTSDQRTPALVDRDLRLTIANAAGAIDAWRDSTGRLPATLAAAGRADEPLDYAPLDSGTYEIAGADGTLRLTYRSTTPLAAFLEAAGVTPP